MRPRTASALAPAALLAALFASLTTACGGAGTTPPTMQGRAGMLSQTAVAQKCEEAARGHDRPFVVEWDATDLSTFEAAAASRTIFVRYEGCKLDVVHECKDPVAVTKFGAYGTPHFTSGTVQGFDVKNEGELYAKLPLGVASLSGRVQAGETLHLKYFVSGVATNSRDAIYRGELASAPGCARATHYVWTYNLGAFELDSSAQDSVAAEAGVGRIGASGARKHQESSLGRGGSLASCETQDQRACRVPIRLALKPIQDGDNPAGQAPPPAVAGGTPLPGGGAAGFDFSSTPAGQANEAYMAAIRQLTDAQDGAGCLQLLGRALQLDPRQADSPGFRRTHASCLMRAGKCDEGVKEFRQLIASQDDKRIRSDDDLDHEARRVANHECPSATAKNASDFIVRASAEMTRVAAAKDAKACQEKFEAIYAKINDADREDKAARQANKPGASVGARGPGTSALAAGAKCVAEATKSCAKGLALHKRQYCVQLRDMNGCEKIAEENWKTLIKFGKDRPNEPLVGVHCD
jgi:hypothetical protein